jgi:hypothetical protein
MDGSSSSNSSVPANPAPGIPLIESPFFDQFFSESSTDLETLRIARDLRDKGFAAFDFPDPEIFEMADRIIHDLDSHYDWQSWRNGTLDSLRVQDAWTNQKDVARIASHPGIVSLLSRLYGRRAFPFQTLNFPVGTQQDYHSDSLHFSCSPERFMCGVWVALEDIDTTNGPLIYYPGTHRWPIYSFEHLGINPDGQTTTRDLCLTFISFWRKLVAVNGVKFQRFLARKGQALIWTANLLHGGDHQADLSRTRHSQVTHYYFEDCCYYTPVDSYPMYGRISFREPIDISRNRNVKNIAAGKAVPEQFISSTRPKLSRVPEGFSPGRYLELNPDVAAAGVDPVQHYLEYGFREGRRYS